jgi:dolichyl-phosphate mannosyltransferase polypeptide 2 regulatory subunit
MTDRTLQGGSDKALGSIMLLAASAVFTYYTIWAILLVSFNLQLTSLLYANGT